MEQLANSPAAGTQNPHYQINASNILRLLDQCDQHTKVLSLDCFDTIIWRKTALPRDIFYAMQHKPAFKALGATAHQRMAAAARAYRAKFISHNSKQISLNDIYHFFSSLSSEQQQQLANEEFHTEIENTFAFTPCIELIRAAKKRGLKVIIVSDIYLNEEQLRQMLTAHLPFDVMQAIDKIYSSINYGVAKGDGLFPIVLKDLQIDAAQMLHFGDHQISDFEAPRKLGIKAFHFLQFDKKTADFLRLQTSAASLAVLSRPIHHYTKEARYSPFRPIFSLQTPLPETAENIIGYRTFGPLLYAFSQFVTKEIAELKKAGKKVKAFFLLRDAYLLKQACDAFAGESVGELARIRKYLAVAAAFRTQEDIDYYLSSVKPEFYNTWVICNQLLFNDDEISKIQASIHQATDQQQAFYKVLHHPDLMKLIFERSAQLRQRLKKYLTDHLHIKAGDTVVLIDTGYQGVTQDFLVRALQEEMNIEITGRYFINAHDPDRANSRALLTSAWCEHGLFEQSCTYEEGATKDYDETGLPIFDEVKLTDQQYASIVPLQNEAIRFIKDAKAYFKTCPLNLTIEILQNATEATLIRHIFFPTPQEIMYFQIFQHDKDMGHDKKKTMFNLTNAHHNRKATHDHYYGHPYEERAYHLDRSLSSFVKRAFDIEFNYEETSYYLEHLKVILLTGDQYEQSNITAHPTSFGYFSCQIPVKPNQHLGIVFGDNYESVQIEKIGLLYHPAINLLQHDGSFALHKMSRYKNIFNCDDSESYLLIMNNEQQQQLIYQIVFRPLIYRKELNFNSRLYRDE